MDRERRRGWSAHDARRAAWRRMEASSSTRQRVVMRVVLITSSRFCAMCTMLFGCWVAIPPSRGCRY